MTSSEREAYESQIKRLETRVTSMEENNETTAQKFEDLLSIISTERDEDKKKLAELRTEVASLNRDATGRYDGRQRLGRLEAEVESLASCVKRVAIQQSDTEVQDKAQTGISPIASNPRVRGGITPFDRCTPRKRGNYD